MITLIDQLIEKAENIKQHYIEGNLTEKETKKLIHQLCKAGITKVKKISVQPHVKRCFKISKINFSKCSFEKNGCGVMVFDLSDYKEDLRVMGVQFFFKTGIAIWYKLKLVEHQNIA